MGATKAVFQTRELGTGSPGNSREKQSAVHGMETALP